MTHRDESPSLRSLDCHNPATAQDTYLLETPATLLIASLAQHRAALDLKRHTEQPAPSLSESIDFESFDV